MKIDTMKWLMEIQALQQLNVNGTAPTHGSSPFAMILQQLSEAAGFDQPAAAHVMPAISTPAMPAVPNTQSLEHHHSISSAPKDIDSIIERMSSKYGVNAGLIRSVIQQESGFNPLSKSPAGAMGLMQLMPATAKSLGVQNPYNPEDNIEGGVKYIKQLLERYDGDEKLALAAYNAGPGNVAKYGGIPPFEETQNYVNKVMESYQTMNA
ncbi:lytic transglycosylase domain-containing protein [Fictibacillus sp. NRS-1165]|uniref:lytic transglycosylase domain-containing protein n=1 Tax=Fictibacillus sp. NRS-1165 TaxID=3144463 RepID=UPI003D21F792